MFKVDIYIEIDGNDKKTRYRTYIAIIKFVTKHKKTVTRETHGTEKADQGRIILIALVSALNMLIKPCEVKVYMPKCRYVTETICRGRMYEWLSNGWNTIQSKPIKNCDEWKKIIRLTEKHKITFYESKTHEYSDKLQDGIRLLKNSAGWQQLEIRGGAV